MEPSHANNLKPPVIVLGSGITVVATLRSLGRAGLRAYCPSQPFMSENLSRWYHSCPGLKQRLTEQDSIGNFLESAPFDRAVLMPCSDHWTKEVASLPDELQNRFPASQSGLGVQLTLTHKWKFHQALAEADIPRPRTFLADSANCVESISDIDLEHFFIKPCNSQEFSQHYNVKGFWPKTRAECIEKIHSFKEAGFELLLQEYIPGPPSNHYYVEGLIDRNGTPRGTFCRQRLRMCPRDFGNSTYMVSIGPEEVAPAITSIHKLLKALGFRGIYSAEFKRDQRDGVFRLLEVNARPFWYIELATLCGINLPALAYQDALGQPLPEPSSYRTGVKMINFFSDFSLWRTLRQTGEVSSLEWLPSWITSHPTVFSFSDPVPGIAWIMRRAKNRFSQQVANFGPHA